MGMKSQRSAIVLVIAMLGFAANAVALTPPLQPRIFPTRFISDGDSFTVSYYGFEAPVRVFFTGSDGIARACFVLFVNSEQVTGFTPRIDTGGEEREYSVTIVNRAGTPNESRIEVSNRATVYELDRTLKVLGVGPSSSPVNGGARLTVYGSGFSAPVQLFVIDPDGSEQEVPVISAAFYSVDFISPPSRMLFPVGLRVVNVASGASVTLPNAFRYYIPMTIQSTRPLSGPSTGGTAITIDGSGFDDPLSVTVAGVAASVIRVSGTQFQAVTNARRATRCEDASGPIIVINALTGDTVAGPTFTYTTPRARFVALPSEMVAGSTGDITIGTLSNPIRFEFHNRVVRPASVRDNGNGTSTYSIPIPTDLLFRTRRCRRDDAIVALPLTTSFTVTDLVTTCSATEVLVVQPEPAAAVCASELPGSAAP
ncbi:MAG: hypothetical protein QOI24_4551 [Acidobacteriota bacterium]|jgi:hypothetical protein|nr:hypothetical protein [Acidobacteriota bacterium]